MTGTFHPFKILMEVQFSFPQKIQPLNYLLKVVHLLNVQFLRMEQVVQYIWIMVIVFFLKIVVINAAHITIMALFHILILIISTKYLIQPLLDVVRYTMVTHFVICLETLLFNP